MRSYFCWTRHSETHYFNSDLIPMIWWRARGLLVLKTMRTLVLKQLILSMNSRICRNRQGRKSRIRFKSIRRNAERLWRADSMSHWMNYVRMSTWRIQKKTTRIQGNRIRISSGWRNQLTRILGSQIIWTTSRDLNWGKFARSSWDSLI